MLNFYKDNAKTVSKLILYQFGAIILALSMSGFSVGKRPWLFAATSLFSTLFYLSLTYSAMWEAGGYERIKIDGGRAEMKPLNGLWISLIANAPNILFAVLIFISFVFGSDQGIINIGFIGAVGGVVMTVSRLYQAMYLGLIQTFSATDPIPYFLIILPSLFVSTGAYYLGVNNKRLFGFIKKSKKK